MARQKGRAQALTSPRRAAIMRRKSVKVERKATHGKHTQNARHPARQRTETHACIRKRKKYPLRWQLSRRKKYARQRFFCASTNAFPLCAFYKKIMRDLGGRRIDFCGHRAYNSIMARERKPIGGREAKTGWRQKSFVRPLFFSTWMAP